MYVSDEAFPQAKLLILEVIDHELVELKSFNDLSQLFLRFETLTLQTIEDRKSFGQVVNHLVTVVVQHVRKNESLLVFVDQESFELSCFLD